MREKGLNRSRAALKKSCNGNENLEIYTFSTSCLLFAFLLLDLNSDYSKKILFGRHDKMGRGYSANIACIGKEIFDEEPSSIVPMYCFIVKV